MVRWTPPVGTFTWSRTVALAALFWIFELFFNLTSLGWTGLLYMGIALAVSVVVIYILANRFLGDVYYHEMSSWRMNEDQVLQRLAQAMAAKGARPPIERRGKEVWFHLPPLSVVVRSRLLRTGVFVGPSTEDNELLVNRLKNFVERALAESK